MHALNVGDYPFIGLDKFVGLDKFKDFQSS
jgi:hypothetical protein